MPRQTPRRRSSSSACASRRPEAERDALDAQRRERAREYMEPDDDLKMPVGQKIVLLALAVIVALFVISVVGGGLIAN